MEITFANIFGENGEYLKQKYSLENYYEAMITLAEGKPCVDPEIVKDLHTTYEELLAEPKSSLEYTLKKYIRKQITFDQELDVNCETIPAVQPEVPAETSGEISDAI